eukprot:2297-Chlamydomonas_euryale.AAC.1
MRTVRSFDVDASRWGTSGEKATAKLRALRGAACKQGGLVWHGQEKGDGKAVGSAGRSHKRGGVGWKCEPRVSTEHTATRPSPPRHTYVWPTSLCTVLAGAPPRGSVWYTNTAPSSDVAAKRPLCNELHAMPLRQKVGC